MTVFKADGVGRWALYSGTDDAPFTNPRANIARIHGTSEFDYLAFDNENPDISITVNIPATVSGRFRSITVGPHGKSGVPFVFGQIFVDGQWTPITGSVPAFVSSATIGGYWSGHLVNWTVELSATHIYIRECRTTPTFSGLPVNRQARFFISDNVMD